MGPFVRGQSAYWVQYNSGKKSLGLDMRNEKGKEIVRELIKISAYGQDGPYRDRIGFDPIGQAISGMMSLTGFPGTPPTRTYNPIIDRITALHGTISALAALHERSLSGEGQCVDVCLADTGFSLTEIPITAYHGAGTEPRRGKADSAPS